MEAVLLDFTNSNKIINRFLGSFLNGFRQAGGNHQSIDIFKTQILDCKGCTEDIFFQSDGNCQCFDEFSQFYPQLRERNLWFFAIDLEQRDYFPRLLNVLNRMEPLFQPNYNGDSVGAKKSIFAFIFSGSRDRHINPLVHLLKEFSQLYGYDFIGTLHRPNYDLFELLPDSISSDFNFEQDFERLGFEFARTGKVDETISQRLERNLLPNDSFLKDFALLLRSF
jgi:multimeric flavodoxin WrbA